eukprot:scaffold267914_cov31-Tisochrysis_lutea.AAC.3
MMTTGATWRNAQEAGRVRNISRAQYSPTRRIECARVGGWRLNRQAVACLAVQGLILLDRGSIPVLWLSRITFI